MLELGILNYEGDCSWGIPSGKKFPVRELLVVGDELQLSVAS